MIRAYKFLLRPTSRQAQALGEMLRDHCSLYNGALQERRDAYRHTSKTSVRYKQQSAQLKEIRSFDPERQGRWSFSSQQATLRRLDRAFQAFFRRVKAGQKPGYPRFRGVNWFDTVEFPTDGDGCRWASTPHDPVTRVRLQGIGHVRVHQHRPVKGRVKTISVKREGKRWYVVLACDQVEAEPLPATGAVTGIDMGVTHFLTTSGGAHVENPRHGKRNADALAKAQQALTAFPRRKRENRTAKHRRMVEKVAALHRKVRRQRLDHAHKTALALVRDYDQIAHERLNIASMVRTPKPKPDPATPGAFLPNGASAKAGLNRSIIDAGWGVFLGIVAQKAESAARVLIPVDPRHTSCTCPGCGHVDGRNRDGEKFQCTACGHIDHADRVGAWNVALRAGLALPGVA
ncbi:MULTISPECIES: RNA-guided endonuclease InsQ/TnpB family protein [unclassified Streptomyces]|uniref:RNA-guided endonuclease InsQ/TnpB family protein n=1 Tax=unclassified Streptomyces TaxID=2593676 RepID=UPI00386DCF94|nr:transposase [Streptomyces sp. NBC_01017]